MSILESYNLGLTYEDEGKTIILPKPIKRFSLRTIASVVHIDGIGQVSSGYTNLLNVFEFNEGIKKLKILGMSGDSPRLQIIVYENGNPEDDLKLKFLGREVIQIV